MVQPARPSAGHQAFADVLTGNSQQVVGQAELAGQPGQAPELGVGHPDSLRQASSRRYGASGSPAPSSSTYRRAASPSPPAPGSRPGSGSSTAPEQRPQAVEHRRPPSGDGPPGRSDSARAVISCGAGRAPPPNVRPRQPRRLQAGASPPSRAQLALVCPSSLGARHEPAERRRAARASPHAGRGPPPRTTRSPTAATSARGNATDPGARWWASAAPSQRRDRPALDAATAAALETELDIDRMPKPRSARPATTATPASLVVAQRADQATGGPGRPRSADTPVPRPVAVGGRPAGDDGLAVAEHALDDRVRRARPGPGRTRRPRASPRPRVGPGPPSLAAGARYAHPLVARRPRGRARPRRSPLSAGRPSRSSYWPAEERSGASSPTAEERTASGSPSRRTIVIDIVEHAPRRDRHDQRRRDRQPELDQPREAGRLAADLVGGNRPSSTITGWPGRSRAPAASSSTPRSRSSRVSRSGGRSRPATARGPAGVPRRTASGSR